MSQSAVCTCHKGSGTSVSSTVPTCGPARQNHRSHSPNFSEDSLSEENCPCSPAAAAGDLPEKDDVLVLRTTSHQQRRENRRSLTQEYLLNAQLQQSSEAPRAVQLQHSSEAPRAALTAQQDGSHAACPAETGVRIRPSDRRTVRAPGRRHVPEIQLMPMPDSNGRTQPSVSDSNGRIQPSVSDSNGRIQPSVLDSNGRIQPSVPDSNGRIQPSVPESRSELVDVDAVQLRRTQSRPHIADIRRRSLQADALLRGIEGSAVTDFNIEGGSIAASAHDRRCSIGDGLSDHGGRVERHQRQHRASLPATGVHLQRSASRAYDERPCASSAREKSAGAVLTWWEETRSSSKPNSQSVLMRRGSVGGRLQTISTSTRSIPAAIKACNTSPASASAAASSRRSSQPQRRMAFTVQLEDTHVEEDAEKGAGSVGPGNGEDGVKHRQRRTPTQAQSDTGEAATTCRTSVNNGIDMLTPRRKRPGAPGYHSEGYFSSDQDVLEPVNVAADAIREGRKLSQRSSVAGIGRNASTVKTRTPSPRRNGTSAIQRPSRNSSAAGVTARTAPPARGGLRRSSTLGTVPVAAHRRADAAPVVRDDVSEAGTYTIDNDDADDMEEGPGDEEAGATAAVIDLRRAGDDSSKDGSPDRDTETSSKPSAYSSSGSNWIEQWAAEVTRHNQQNLTKRTSSGSGGVSKPPSGSGGSSAGVRSPVEADGCSNATANAGSTSTRSQHQRRKLPTPPRTVAMVSPGAVDTSSYLRTTEDVVCALQARLDKHNVSDSASRLHPQQLQTVHPTRPDPQQLQTVQPTRPDHQHLAVTDDSASERDETRCRQRQQLRRPGSGSTRQGGSGSTRQGGCGSTRQGGCGSARPALSTTAEFKFNRALSLRRARLGLDDGSSAVPRRVAPSITSTAARNPGSSVAARRASSQAVDTRSCSSAGGFARSDGGRFSLRAANGGATCHKTNSSTVGAVRKSTGAVGATRGGSRSSLSSSLTVQQQARTQELANWRRRKNYDPLKAARQDKQPKTGGGATEEKRGVGTAPSAGGTTVCDRSSCRGGPLRSASFHGTAVTGGPLGDSGDGDACPPCPLQRQGTTGPGGGLYSSGYQRATYRTGSSIAAGHHDANGTQTASAPAPAAKKALDNLVISTIHTLSGQIKLNAELLVSKLKCGFEEDDVRYTLLDDVLTTLSADIPGATRAPSRDLAVILKNLRKLELTVQVLDQVLCEDDEEVDVDDCDLSDLEAEDVSAAVDASPIHQLKSTKFGDGFY